MKFLSYCAGIMALLGLFLANPVFAKMGDKSASVGLGIGTAPAPGWGSGYGFSIGGGYEIQDDLQIRGDVSYFSWTLDSVGDSLTYSRMPISVSARQYFPVQQNLKAYGQAGLEMSLDKFEWSDIASSVSSTSESNFGITPGGGIEYSINPQLSIGVQGLYHIITNSYITLGITGGYHF